MNNFNFLLDPMPVVDGCGNRIKTDFKVWIAFETALQDPFNLINQNTLIINLVNMIYIDKPTDYVSAFNELIGFCNAYREQSNTENSREPIFDWLQDGHRVYSAFMRTYNIDLTTIEYLHWWKFKALLDDIDENTQLASAMYYRSIDLSKEKDSKTRSELAKIKNRYAIK